MSKKPTAIVITVQYVLDKLSQMHDLMDNTPESYKRDEEKQKLDDISEAMRQTIEVEFEMPFEQIVKFHPMRKISGQETKAELEKLHSWLLQQIVNAETAAWKPKNLGETRSIAS